MNKKMESLLNMVDSHMLMSMVEEVNTWDSSLDYLNYITIDEFDGYLEGYAPGEIANMIYYGDFNPYAEYFKFNEYGNLESYNECEVEEDLAYYKEEIIERFIELYEQGNVDTYYEEVKAILDSEE